MAIVHNSTNQPNTAASPKGQASANSAAGEGQNKKLLSDEVVTLNIVNASDKKQSVPLKEYKSHVGQDSAFVKDTLRNKLAEYQQNPAAKLALGRDAQGQIMVSGPIPEHAQQAISRDLNNNNPFKAAFNRLSTNQPTLDYVEKVTKLTNAYGVDNNLFSSLVSKQDGNNSLTDIAHRFQSLKHHYQTEHSAELYNTDQPYQFTVNA